MALQEINAVWHDVSQPEGTVEEESAAIDVEIQTLQQAQEPGLAEWTKENVSVGSVRWSELARSRDE